MQPDENDLLARPALWASRYAGLEDLCERQVAKLEAIRDINGWVDSEDIDAILNG